MNPIFVMPIFNSIFHLHRSKQIMGHDDDEGKGVPLCLSSFTAAEYGKIEALSRKDASSLLNASDSGGNSPLHIAAQHGHLPVCQWLIAVVGFSPDVKNKGGATPLHRSSYTGAVECMSVVIDALHNARQVLLAGDYSFGDGRTALHKAAAGGRPLAVLLLLEHLRRHDMIQDALSSQDAEGLTPLQVAIESGSSKANATARWDSVAGGPSDWNRCMVLLEGAAGQKSRRLELPPLPDPEEIGTQWDPATLNESLFRKYLLMVVRESSTISSEIGGPKHDESQGSDHSSTFSRSGKDTNEPLSNAATVSGHQHLPGRKCDECQVVSMSLFPIGDLGRLVCRKCRKESRKLLF